MPTKQYAAKVTIGGALQSSFKTAFGGASSAIKNLGSEVRGLARQRAELRKFADTSKKIDGLKQSLVGANAKLAEAKHALAGAAKPTATLTRAVDAAQRKVKALETSIQGESAALTTLQSKLNAAGLKTKDFARHEDALRRKIEATTKAVRRHEAAKSNLGDARGRFGSMMGAGLVVGGALTAFIPAVKASNEFADTMVDVGKYVDGLDTAGKLASFGETIREIGRSSPLGAKGVAELVIGAGKLGMKAPEAMEFAKAMEVMAAGLDMMPEEAATILTKIKSSMRQTVPEAIKLGDAMNYLGDVTASDSKNIAEIMSRVGSTVKSDTNSSLTDAEIAAVAAQFDIAAPNAESGATAMKNFTKALSKGEAATRGNWWAYNQLGLDPIAMGKRMTVDAKGAINQTLEALGKLKPDKRAAVMSKLFGEESKGVIQNVIAAQNDLKKSLAAVGKESNFVGRSEQERRRNMEKFSVQLPLFKSKIKDINISIGDVVKDAIGPLLGKTNKLLDQFFLWQKKNPALFKSIVKGTAVCVAFAAAVVGIGIAGSAIGVIWSGLGVIFSGIAFIVGGLSLPFIAVGAAVVAAAALIYKYWEPISAFFAGVWKGITDGWKSSGGDAFWDKISGAFGKAKDAVMSFLEPVKLSPQEFQKFFESGEKVGKFIGETLVGFINGSVEFIKLFITTIKDMGSGIADFFGGLMDKMKPFFDFIGSQVTALMGSIEKLKSWMDSSSGSTKKAGTFNPATSPGGNFMPPASFNAPAMKGKETSQINNFQINSQPGQSEEGIARAVARVLSNQREQDARGSFFDAAYA